jgi:hypothetical protein
MPLNTSWNKFQDNKCIGSSFLYAVKDIRTVPSALPGLLSAAFHSVYTALHKIKILAGSVIYLFFLSHVGLMEEGEK